MELIIEEINRGKKLIGRHKFSGQQIQVGRGYDNDIILTDPHVCAQHLKLKFFDDCWHVIDLNSLNGSLFKGNKNLSDWQKIESGDIITLGKTQLRFISPKHPVAASVEFSIVEDIVEYLGRWPVVFFMLLLFAGISGWQIYLNVPTKEVNYTQISVIAIGITLGYAIWPLFCSLMSHLNKQEIRISQQLGFSFLIFNLFWFLDFFELFFEFNLSSQWSIYWLSFFAAIFLTALLFWFNFYIGFTQTASRRLKMSIGLSVFIYAGMYLYDLSEQPQYQFRPSYNSTIMTPGFHLSEPSSAEQFIQQSNTLFKRVEDKAKDAKAN
ncbi:FHA domain-containing protein [Thalassotalea aquiviva]|uniref:FHA domain-containing protein n=1 Tax=Thalassotalea aquiviva TaxID=3242415 RepID=UPI00352AD059